MTVDEQKRWLDKVDGALERLHQGDPDPLLEALREPHLSLGKEHTPYLAGRAWDTAGLPEVALRFFDVVSAANPQFNFISLALMNREGWAEVAVPRAEQLLRRKMTFPPVVFFAASTLMQQGDGTLSKNTLGLIIDSLTHAIGHTDKEDPQWRTVPGLYPGMKVMLALCLSKEGSVSRAVNICNQLMSIEPQNPDLFSIRGIVRLKSEYDAAIIDFSTAIKLNTQHAGAYLHVAKDMIQKGRPGEAARTCLQALNGAAPLDNVTRAYLLDLLTSAWARLGQPLARLLELMNEAVDLVPDNKQIRANRDSLAHAVDIETYRRNIPKPAATNEFDEGRGLVQRYNRRASFDLIKSRDLVPS